MTDMRSLWRNQKAEETVTLENVHERAEKFHRTIRNRNLREYFAVAFVVAIFSWYVWVLPGWMTKAGSAVVVASALFTAWKLYRLRPVRVASVPTSVGLVDFYRRELIRHRDAVKSIWLWYILPYVVGIILMMLGRYFQFHVPGRPLDLDHLIIILSTVIVILMFVIVWLLNMLAVAKLQSKIDELDKLSN